jgi:hypothetical protein
METPTKKTWFARLIGSLDNEIGGMSARKLSAFTGVVVVSVGITYRFCNADNLVQVLVVWLAFSLLCLGIVTAEQVIRFREGNTSRTSSELKIEKTETVQK